MWSTKLKKSHMAETAPFPWGPTHHHVTPCQPHPVHLCTHHSTLLMQTLHPLCLFATVDHLIVVVSLQLKLLHQSHGIAFNYGFNFFLHTI